MNVSEEFKKIEGEICSLPCPQCGKNHSITLNAHGDSLNPAVTYRFTDDTCPEYKTMAIRYISDRHHQLRFPFP